MAGRKHLLICLLAFAASAYPSAAEEQPSSQEPVKVEGKRRGRNPDAHSPELENVRRAIDALTPEQRRRFKENFAKWINLSPEEKRALRDRDEMRRKRMRQEIDEAIRDAGLQLEGERRNQFAKRYAEERKKVEEELRQEMRKQRQPKLRAIVEKLRDEFSQPESAAPASVEGGTETP